MSCDISTPLNDQTLCASLLRQLEREIAARFTAQEPFTFMEVCGTHTVSIFRSGLANLLPKGIRHLSGPGCPVCVTHDREIAALIDLSLMPGVCIATFGDMLRIPDPEKRSLKWAKARGAHVEIVYSPLDALDLAKRMPDRLVVFPAVGFETTAPAVAATILAAHRAASPNFAVLCLHKRVPPALDALCAEGNAIHGFLLPGHVCVITGTEPFDFLPSLYNIPAAVTGFEPADILRSLLWLVRQSGKPAPPVYNGYSRAVAQQGNAHAREIMNQVFVPADACWRGLEEIPAGGLRLRPEYAHFDVLNRLGLALPEVKKNTKCMCGAVLKGILRPGRCPLFKKDCTPAHPVGPCMVSTEGSCAAEYAYSL